MAEMTAIIVGKWHVGYHHDSEGSLLHLEWTDRAPLTFLIPPDEAIRLANAILDQYKTTPPRRGRMN